ncbi:class I SAM-dependent methyltransferase [Microbacterium pygmaeum]|uniref:Methyltransferase domain-containing protein n=1 Tax=Microbacterium pygmaeum TaxID=370764 RepID=A0A1G7TY26_9MICO|nr:class I SAM-dependent methyltransferase [Microbacterium pygmaeum]SDG39410.1 Methyltransferase domain-containing protein [Microbacterium pygmaeum]
MDRYALPHDLSGEPDRLALMSQMLDPQLFFRLRQIGVGQGWRCLEVGAGNGSVSRWLGQQVGETGSVIVSDLTPDLIRAVEAPNVEVKAIDVTSDELGSGYDLVVARALLHHLPGRTAVLGRLAEAVGEGGWLVLEEPDFHPVLATDNPELRDFWEGWLAWAASEDIDYFVGRRIAARMIALGLQDVRAWGETILYRGGSLTARYLSSTMHELHDRLLASGFISPRVWDDAMALFENEDFWSWQNSYVTTVGRRAAGRGRRGS